MHLLYSRINNLDLPIDLQLKLFDHTVLPILTYGSEIWGFENLDIIEEFTPNFSEELQKSRKSTPLYMLYAELGRHPLAVIVKTKMLSFWNRIVSGKQYKLSFMVYEYISALPTFHSKWTHFIQQILNETGHPGAFVNATEKVNIKHIKATLVDQFIQTWNVKLNESGKGRNYNIFKGSVNLENYFKCLPKGYV